MKKVFLDELPRGGKYINKNLINWKESIGHKVHFIYDDIEDEIEIIGYDTKTKCLTIKYRDKIKPIKRDMFSICQLGNILGKKTRDFKVEIGTIFKDNKRDITIIDRKYEIDKSGIRRKLYKYHCNNDGNEDWMKEEHILNGIGCNVCGNDKVTEYNCMWNTHRELCEQLGVPKEVAETVTYGSNKPINFNCKCGNEVTVKPCNIIINKSIGCKKCSDGISYPNKYKHEFYNQLLEQGQIKNYIPEYKIKNRNYDMFVTLNNGETLIDETHGEQHGKFIYNGDIIFVKYTRKCFNKNNKRDDIKNDIYKCRLAYDMGIDNYIQSDCTISDPDYIKYNIENSWLADMFDLSNIDWNKCDEYALKNIVKEVSEYWHEHREVNKEDITTKDLSNIFKYDKSTIIDYLHKGNNLGLCNYNGEEEKRRASSKNVKHAQESSKKQILIYDLNMNYITESESIAWIQKHSIEKFGTKLYSGNIIDVCKGKKTSYKGFIFKYKKTIDK